MYNHKEIEKKWQNFWEKNKTFKTPNPWDKDFDETKPKYYTLDMFPYPSWAGLHVGHPEWYTANDIIARYKHAKWYNVLHPMGWDAFWLPAENYAIKTWTHPRITTDKNINTFRKQIKSLWISYDWDREIDTTDPEYYKWTQWIFLKMFEAGLAYEQDLPINYCPSCKTGLANEEVLNDFTCERCGTKVEKKKIRQWVLAITKYADRLLKDVDKLDWPESIKEMQRNWIWKSEGCEFEMKKAQKKWNSPISNNGVGHDVLARIPLKDIILENLQKVKKKNKKIKLSSINILKKVNLWNIKINWEYLYKHFQKKQRKEFLLRTSLFTTINKYIEDIHFKDNIWYIVINNFIIKIILWNDNNWLFLKTYYISDKLTKQYKDFLKQQQDTPSIRVYTTRIDTVFGMTYAVLAPDHKDVEKFITPEQKEVCEKYIEEASKKSDLDRTADNKEKTWVFTWSYVINPFNWKEVPLWIADYVLWNYWTWAVMAVPAHDQRDFEFAKKYNLEIVQSIAPKNKKEVELPFTEYWILVNSWKFTWLESKKAQEKLIEFAIKEWFWEKKVNYKLRDWLFSRQRYWWEPIPLIHLENENVKKLPHISEEEFGELQEKIENYLNKKMRSAPLEKPELVGPLANTANFSLLRHYIYNLKKIKKKRTKNFKLKFFLEKIKLNWKIINISWQYLIEHFKNKKGWEKARRMEFAETILTNIDKITFVNDNYWLLNINDRIWLLVFEKENNTNNYFLVTYYPLIYLNKFLNKAYILKRKPKEWENVAGAICSNSWMVRELIIWWKVFSKIYDWIYWKIVCDYRLPLELPEVKKFEPAGDGQSPLANVDSFVNIKLAENLVWKRETNTMPQWWGSCWYYLRYMDPKNPTKLVDPKIEKYWGQVDSYVWGAEHAVLHLLYARFWHKFLFDIGVVSSDEPFYRLRNQGLILSHAFERKNWWLVAVDLVEEKDWKYYHKETWEELKKVIAKMSKSLKNVVNPDDIINEYWADSLRLYEMYMADFKDSAPWDTKNIIWVRRFLEKVERLYTSEAKIAKDDNEAMKLLNKTIKKVEEDIENYKFNTAIAQLMILVNNWLPKDENKKQEFKEKLAIILSPFAPHLVEELWERLWKKESVFFASWPEYDKKLVVDDTIKIAVQVLWKVRWTIEITKDEDKESVLEKAKNNEWVKKWISWKEIIKEIYVPWKIVNFVVK